MGLVPNAITPTPISTSGTPSKKQIIRIQCDGTNSHDTAVTSSDRILPISATADPTSATLDADPAMNDNGNPNPGIHVSHSCNPDVSPVVAIAPVVCAAAGGTFPRRNFL